MRRKVLFLSEAVTWSQVVRLVVLARGLDPSRNEVHFASARFDDRLFGGARFRRWPIHSLSPATVDARVARGARIYDRSTLARYVDEELRLFRAVGPDLVVSDLRWSTTISAPAFGVPLATLIDAYWFRALDRYPLPDLAVLRWLGVHAESGYRRALPFVLRHFAAPVNALRRAHGLPPFGDLRDVLAFGDHLLFPDDPALIPGVERAGSFLGPISWSPDVPLPDWWGALGERPVVYVTMGSSGPLSVVPKILAALETLDVEVVLSTAGRFAAPPHVRAVSAIRGDLAARRAELVICSGGASTAFQALAEGRPVVGIPANLDACLSMSCIEEAGAGIMLRPSVSVPSLRAAVERALHDASIRERAGALARSFATHDPHAAFARATAPTARASVPAVDVRRFA